MANGKSTLMAKWFFFFSPFNCTLTNTNQNSNKEEPSWSNQKQINSGNRKNYHACKDRGAIYQKGGAQPRLGTQNAIEIE